jgi:hypothetical protein
MDKEYVDKVIASIKRLIEATSSEERTMITKAIPFSEHTFTKEERSYIMNSFPGYAVYYSKEISIPHTDEYMTIFLLIGDKENDK